MEAVLPVGIFTILTGLLFLESMKKPKAGLALLEILQFISDQAIPVLSSFKINNDSLKTDSISYFMEQQYLL
jgi:hypothetical protein